MYLFVFLPLLVTSFGIPVLEISNTTHDYLTILNILYKAYLEVGKSQSESSAANGLAAKLSGNGECVNGSTIKYHMTKAVLTSLEYPASECRLNTHSEHHCVLEPSSDFQASTPANQPLLELAERAQQYTQKLFPDFVFNDFSALDFSLQCSAGYYELVQVMYNETLVRATITTQVDVPETCSFSNINLNFGEQFISQINVDMPLNASFYCKHGRSAFCKMATAKTKNARFRVGST